MQKRVRIFTRPHYRAYTLLIFKHLQFIKLHVIDNYMLTDMYFNFLRAYYQPTLSIYLDYHKFDMVKTSYTQQPKKRWLKIGTLPGS